jgi:hypothetical protein
VTEVRQASLGGPATDNVAGRRGGIEAFVGAWERARESGSSSDEGSPDAVLLGPVRPYPGLRSFSADEHALFYGRDAQAIKVRDRLSQSGIVFVLGGSGTGKSSLVRAGVLPNVRATGELGERRSYLRRRVSPGDRSARAAPQGDRGAGPRRLRQAGPGRFGDCVRPRCGSACKKDPGSGVIGVE